MDDITLLRSLEEAVRPLYTELVVLRTAIDAIKQVYPDKASEIDRMLEFARHSKDTAKQVDIEQSIAAEIWRTLQSASDGPLHLPT